MMTSYLKLKSPLNMLNGWRILERVRKVLSWWIVVSAVTEERLCIGWRNPVETLTDRRCQRIEVPCFHATQPCLEFGKPEFNRIEVR